jgi:ribosomal protein S18 acetylase RimI-like enzyme
LPRSGGARSGLARLRRLAEHGFDLRPASGLPLPDLAELFTAGYEGYAVPIRVDEAALSSMVDAYDIDLGRSRVALRDGEPVGLALLAVRGDAGWIGGLGVVAPERRHGVGRMLMEAVLGEARQAGLESVGLEVMEPNAPAIALYEQLGFEATRRLEVWTLDDPAGASDAVSVDVEHAHAWIRKHRRGPEPWQRADGSVASLAGVEAVALRDEGAVLLRVSDRRVSVLQLGAVGERAARDLLAGARARGDSLSFLNVPEGDPASAALQALGGRLTTRQLEMARRP